MEPAVSAQGGVPPAELAVTHFEPLVGVDFSLHLPEGRVLRLVLEQAQVTGKPFRPGARTPFSLLFRCPELPPEQYLAQGSYRVDQPQLGTQELFFSPRQPDARGFSYESTFT